MNTMTQRRKLMRPTPFNMIAFVAVFALAQVGLIFLIGLLVK